jgi:phosphomannomutase
MDLQAALDAARTWIAGDPDPQTRAELEQLVQAADPALTELMGGRLNFGTAGLRAVVGPGPLRMNRAVVRCTTAGVARYLLNQATGGASSNGANPSAGEPSAAAPLVVVGADARLSSASFMEDTVRTLAGYGLSVRYFERPIATPIVAYAARRLGAQAAIVVTASHNPAAYNGYKLYGDNAVQIVEPVDSDITAEIARSLPASQERYDSAPLGPEHAHCRPVPTELLEDYFREVDGLRPKGKPARDLSIVYTPLHGVGHWAVARVLSAAGFTNVHSVAEQQEPDGNFPTVQFPNPEEAGALDRAQALAQKVQADLIIANDPDADRLAASLPDGRGGYRQLTGNQLGVLLADALLERAPKSPMPLVAQSIVSSPMLASVAAAHGAHAELTFTGFKWIWTAALDLMADGHYNYVFGYEEALGYCAGHLVRDKDGISAALLLCELAAQEKAQGSSLAARLERLYRRHGLWVSVQKSVTLEGLEGAARIERAMVELSARPPKRVLDQAVARTIDYNRNAEQRPRWLSRTPLVSLELQSGARILVRPSGTEPKLKIYVDLRAPLGPGDAAADREAEARKQANSLAAATVSLLGLG